MDLQSIRLEVARAETIDDLRAIDAIVKDRWRAIQREAQRSFGPGDLVEWDGRRGRETGTVVRLMRKNLLVRAENGVEWRVSPTLLRKVEAAA